MSTYFNLEDIQKIIKDESLTEAKKRELIIKIQRENGNQYQKLYNLNEKEKNFNLINPKPIEPEKEISEEILEEETGEEIDITFYLNQIAHCKNLENLENILPKHNISHFPLIINTILTSYLKEIADVEYIFQTEEMDASEVKEFKEEIKSKKDIMQKIIAYRDKSKEEIKEEEPSHNNLIFLTSPSNNYYIYNDLKAIDVAYYHSFFELLNSIINGTFKNIKSLESFDKAVNFYEVKGNGTRIIFECLNSNTFLIVYAFLKRADNSKYYREQLKNRANRVVNYLKNYKECLNSESYLLEQKLITTDVLSTLRKEDCEKHGRHN